MIVRVAVLAISGVLIVLHRFGPSRGRLLEDAGAPAYLSSGLYMLRRVARWR